MTDQVIDQTQRARDKANEFRAMMHSLGLLEAPVSEFLSKLDTVATHGDVAQLHMRILEISMKVVNHLKEIKEGKQMELEPLIDLVTMQMGDTFDFIMAAANLNGLPSREGSGDPGAAS